MDVLLYNFIMFLFYFPCLIIHEYGHAFAARCYGIPIKSIALGKGKPFFQLGHFFISRKYIWEGLYTPGGPISTLNRTQKSFYYLGGVLFNFICVVIGSLILFLLHNETIHYMLQAFVRMSAIFVIFNLLPLRLFIGFPSDGLQLIYLFKRRDHAQ